MNEYKGFKIGDKVVTRTGVTGVVIGFQKTEYSQFDFTHYIRVKPENDNYTANWYPASLTAIKEEKTIDNERYIVTTLEYSSISSTKKGAEDDIYDLLQTGTTADQIYVYKGVEVEFSHGVVIKEK